MIRVARFGSCASPVFTTFLSSWCVWNARWSRTLGHGSATKWFAARVQYGHPRDGPRGKRAAHNRNSMSHGVAEGLLKSLESREPSCSKNAAWPAHSATRQALQITVLVGENVWRPRPELNRGARICSPLRHHSATRPHNVRSNRSVGRHLE
jgi:hypothetical protein